MIHRYFRLAGYLLPVFIVCTSVALLGAHAKPSGADPYIPTKQEWLCLQFNASYRISIMTHDYSISAVVAADPNKVLLYCRTTPRTDRASFNASVQQSREFIEGMAKTYGFGDRLTVQEEVAMID
jgi:hypothetical protein